MSNIKRSIVELQNIIPRIETIIDLLGEIEITAENYHEASEAMNLLEIYEASIREKRQLVNLKLRRHYMNQYLELHNKRMASPQIYQEQTQKIRVDSAQI